MRYLKGLSKNLFDGKLPEDIVDHYTQKRSVTTPLPPKL
jgi:hypothetical protein